MALHRAIVGLYVYRPRATRTWGSKSPGPFAALTSECVHVAILVSPPLLLTAKVSQGAKVNIFSLDAPKLPPGIPSLRQAELAQIIRVKEVPSRQNKTAGSSSKPNAKDSDSGKGRTRDWLTLLIREALSAFSLPSYPARIFLSLLLPLTSRPVDLGYITPTQTLDIVYEGKPRRFIISAVSTSREAEGNPDIVDGIQSLSLSDAPPKLWTVGWETTVVLDNESSKTAVDEHGTGTKVSQGLTRPDFS